MGRETKTIVTHGEAAAEARVHLDSEMLSIGPPVRVRLALGEIKPSVTAGGLTLKAGRATYLIAMSEKEAGAWAKAISNPPSLADKLGLKAGVSVALVGGLPGEIEALAGMAERFTAMPVRVSAQVTVVKVTGLDVRSLVKIAKALPVKGAVWLIYEKGVVKGDQLIFAARDAGLKDTKVAKISETHTGLRFIPRA